ncbi:MAG TPA: hypothetical protein VM536_03610 [Chloroflexia bacterium]|nr:hypothetical protein [Chloroflexia bacterium]
MDPFATLGTPVASDTTIVEDYPQPLARTWQRVLIASPRASFHHRQLLIAADTVAHYLGAVTIAAYEQYVAEGGKPSSTLNRSLRSLRRPTLGQWLGWVREALAAVPADVSILGGLRAAYESPDASMLLVGYESLRAMMVVQLGYRGDYGPRRAASPRDLLELVNQYQIWRANHALPDGSGFDEMGVVTVLGPGLRAVMGRLAGLAAYPLLGLVQRAGGGPEVLRLVGLGAEASSVELDADAAPPGTLLLATIDEMPALVLDPWLTYAECAVCGQLQVAAFAGQEDRALQYAGLECEHRWTQSPGVRLAEVDLSDPEQGTAPAGWTPDTGSLPADVPSDAQERLYAALERDAAMLTAERRARPAAPTADVPSAGAAHSEPREVYLDLLEQRAAGGLTLDQLQELDEERAAAEARRRAAESEETR